MGGRAVVLFAVVLALFSGSPAAAQGEASAADSLSEVIDELRQEARYAEAAEAAKELLALLRADPSAKPYEVTDTRLLLATLEAAARLPEAARQELAAADRLDNDIEGKYAEGQYAEAARAAERQLEIRTRLLGEDNREVLSSLLNAGALQNQMGELARAEAALRGALGIARRIFGYDPHTAKCLRHLAECLLNAAEREEASRLLREALAMDLRVLGEADAAVVEDLFNLSQAMTGRDYVAQESLLRQALHIAQTLGDDLMVSDCLNDLGLLQHSRQDYAGAEELFREALEMKRRTLGNEAPSVTSVMHNLALVYLDRGDRARSEPLFRESLALRRRIWGDAHPRVARSLNNLAYLLLDHGEDEEAETLFREALDIRRKALGPDHPDVALSLRDLADLHLARGEPDSAQPLLAEALMIQRSRLGATDREVAVTLHKLGKVAFVMGRQALAESLLVECSTVYEEVRARAGSELERATFLGPPYRSLAAARAEMGRLDDAWPPAERSLGRALGELLRSADSGAPAETFPLERVQASVPERAAIVGWVDVEWAGSVASSWGYVLRRSGPVRWVRLGPPISGDAEPPGRDSARSFRDLLLSEAGWGVRVTDLGRITEGARAAWDERFAPLLPLLEGADHLVVIPSGHMLAVPVEALVDPEGLAVGERYTVSYAPSATLHAWLREGAAGEAHGRLRRALLVGDPPFSPEPARVAEANDPAPREAPALALAAAPGPMLFRSALGGNRDSLALLPRLAASRAEVRDVAALFPEPLTLVGQEASEQALVGLAESGRLREFDVLHVATHALVDEESPERSALVLSQVGLPDAFQAATTGERLYDGLVTTEEILAGWELDAELVTLSGCNTALGREVEWEGYIGFSYAFLQAGARSLVLSLWKVDDRATSLLMRRFYENLTGARGRSWWGGPRPPLPKAEALREAKRWLREWEEPDGSRPFRHPAYWSAFILIGDPT